MDGVSFAGKGKVKLLDSQQIKEVDLTCAHAGAPTYNLPLQNTQTHKHTHTSMQP
jgi:hypothetical protein